MAMLICQDLRRSYGQTVAVDGVSFEVAEGETYGLLGPNGAGKTTTIQMIVGLLRADSGTVTIAGQPMHPSARETKRRVGYVPQEIALYADLTGRENLAFFARLHRMEAAADRIDEVLDVVGLHARADDRVDAYSGGMQRRLNIAVGLLHRPQLLVLDEPTVGVDPQSRDAILAAIETLSTDGMGVVYTTHYMEEAERLCDRIGIIDGGRVVAEGTQRELVASIGQRDQVSLTIAGNRERALERVLRNGAVEEGVLVEDGLLLSVDGAATQLPALIGAVGGMDASVVGVAVREPDLEAVFLRLTGRELRDAV